MFWVAKQGLNVWTACHQHGLCAEIVQTEKLEKPEEAVGARL